MMNLLWMVSFDSPLTLRTSHHMPMILQKPTDHPPPPDQIAFFTPRPPRRRRRPPPVEVAASLLASVADPLARVGVGMGPAENHTRCWGMRLTAVAAGIAADADRPSARDVVDLRCW